MVNRIWVIIPVYNTAEYVRTAAESVLKKERYDTRLILIDDGSTDDSGRICDALAQEYPGVVTIHQKNAGVSCARNVGIEYVLKQQNDGYIAFLDADDLWAQEAALNEVEQEADIIAYSTALSNAQGNQYSLGYRFKNEVQHTDGADCQWINHGHFGAFLYSIRMIRMYGLRFLTGVQWGEDVIFWRQATFCAKRIVFREEIIYIYRKNYASTTQTAWYSLENALRIPKAWETAKTWVMALEGFTSEEKQRWIDECELSVGARLLEMIRILSEQGYRKKDIWAFMWNTPLSAYLFEIDPERLAIWQQKDFALLKKGLSGFVWKHRIRGYFIRCARRIRKLRVIRSLLEKRQYPKESIQSL